MASHSNAGPQLVLIFGGPGAGKGTQARLLSATLGIPHISSGDLLRQDQTSERRTVIQRGDLLPDEEVSRIVLARLQQPDARRGAVLDGFPRTLAQAQALDRWLEEHGGSIRAALFLDVPNEELERRLLARGEQSGRLDDQVRAVPRRLEVFLQELPPILKRYAERGILRTLDGSRDVNEVHRLITEALYEVESK
jgi:adenylate kinase